MSSKVVLLCGGVILLLAGAGIGYLYEVGSAATETTMVVSATTFTTTFTTTSTTVSTSLDAYGQVADSFANHLLALSSKNASAITNQYEENASVTWMGDAGGFQGFYNGTKVIFLLMNGSFISRAGSLSIGNVTRAILDISDNSASVNSSFDISGQNFDFGLHQGYAASFNMTVSAQDSFVYSPSQGAWLILTETWNFVKTNLQYPPPVTG